MRGQILEHTLMIALMTIVVMGVVTTFFTRNVLKFSEFLYLTYEIQTANHIAYTSENFGTVDIDELDKTEFGGKDALLIMVYDLKDRKLIYSHTDDSLLSNPEVQNFFKERIEEMKNMVPGSPGKNYPTDERIRQLLSLVPHVQSSLNKVYPEIAFSEYAMPVLVKSGNDLHPALLIIVSNNAALNMETIKVGEILHRFDWMSGGTE